MLHPTTIYLDAKPVHAIASATFIEQPAEKSPLCHDQYLGELLGKRVLEFSVWVDTWYMKAGGLTKEAVARSLTHTYMNGFMPLQHELVDLASKIAHMNAVRAGSGILSI